MQSEFSPSLTRFDVVMGFLRVQLWTSIVALGGAGISALSYFQVSLGQPIFLLRLVGLAVVPVVVLLLFPSLLAANALGQTSRDSVASLADFRPLIGRCTGLFLFIQSLAPAVLSSGVLIYALLTQPGSLSFGLWPSFPGRYAWLEMGQIIGPVVSLLIGFFLAFGPTLRDNFRPR